MLHTNEPKTRGSLEEQVPGVKQELFSIHELGALYSSRKSPPTAPRSGGWCRVFNRCFNGLALLGVQGRCFPSQECRVYLVSGDKDFSGHRGNSEIILTQFHDIALHKLSIVQSDLICTEGHPEKAEGYQDSGYFFFIIFSPIIRVSILGFLFQSPKSGYIHNWLWIKL